MMLENSFYSVISPEGCAAILWKDQSAVAQAAENMKIRAQDLLALGIIDKIIPEPRAAPISTRSRTFKNVDKHLSQALKKLESKPVKEMLEERYQKFRKMGVFIREVSERKPGETARFRDQGNEGYSARRSPRSGRGSRPSPRPSSSSTATGRSGRRSSRRPSSSKKGPARPRTSSPRRCTRSRTRAAAP